MPSSLRSLPRLDQETGACAQEAAARKREPGLRVAFLFSTAAAIAMRLLAHVAASSLWTGDRPDVALGEPLQAGEDSTPNQLEFMRLSLNFYSMPGPGAQWTRTVPSGMPTG